MSQIGSKTPLRTSPTYPTHQDLLNLEVDLVVLSKELTKLVGFSGSIARQLREYRLSGQERELVLSLEESI